MAPVYHRMSRGAGKHAGALVAFVAKTCFAGTGRVRETGHPPTTISLIKVDGKLDEEIKGKALLRVPSS